MADLSVDYARLEQSERVLGRLKSEFDNIEGDTNDGTSLWSHRDVAEAMEEFGGNMDYNRKKLSEKLENCGKKTSETLKTFRETDAKLASELTEASR